MPLEDVMRRIAERVQPVSLRPTQIAAALGATVARDIVVTELHPAVPLALIDGWAVHAELTADAGPYAPAVLPGLREVAVGEALCGDGDAVAPFEAVTWRGGNGAVHAAMTPGDGVLMPGADAGVGEVLRQTGHRLRAVDVAAMQALGITWVLARKPRVRVARAGQDSNDIADAIADWLASAIAADGGEPVSAKLGGQVEELLTGDGVDAVAMIGGTGAGAHDNTVQALKQTGAVEVHGIALSPGETAAFGIANSRPVLLIPGRLDAAVAVWLLIGQTILARLRGGTEHVCWRKSTLIGKISSAVGLTELVLVRQAGDGVEPLASKYLPLATLAQADGWIVIPAASEGLPPGARVAVYPLP
ncbi:MAG TPA: molybdopterin-binding protein [Xanthobacteraceae bacterium]|nr:molybdopterin-binding protein [Xanthobacteraceae bacterium]